MATKQQKLESLRAAVVTCQNEVAEAQARLNDAAKARYAFEREINRSQKPTPAMLTVLKQMAEGAILRENSYDYGSYYLSTDNGNPKVRASLFYGLRAREAIEETEDRRTYRITEHGKSFLQHSTRG